MAAHDLQRGYPGMAEVIGEEAIPQCIQPHKLPAPIQSTSRISQISAASGNSTSAGGVITFTLPSGPAAGFLKGQSTYFSARVTVSYTAPASAPNNKTIKFGGACNSACALFQRLTVLAGSQPLEQCNNTWTLSNFVLQHMTSTSYVNNDASIAEAAGVSKVMDKTKTGGATVEFDICVPLVSGILQSPHAFPLCLVSSPLQIQIDLTPLALAFEQEAGFAWATSYTVNNPTLVIEQVFPPPAYVDSLKAMMLQGKLYRLPYKTCLASQTPVAGSGAEVSFNMGLNVSSLCAVYWASIKNSELAADKAKLFDKNGKTSAYVLVDGKQVPQLYLNSDPISYNELQRACGVMGDAAITSSVTAIASAGAKLYETHGYVQGVNCRIYDEADLNMRGTPASQLMLSQSHSGGDPATLYLFALYECEALIDVTGTVSVRR